MELKLKSLCVRVQVGLTKGLKAQGNVEDWLCKVEDAMFTSLRRLCKGAIADYQVKSREEWVVAGHPSQVNTHTKKLFSGSCFFFLPPQRIHPKCVCLSTRWC